MQVLQLTTIVDSSGHLHLDILTQLDPGQVNIVLVINPVSTSKDQNLKYDFSDLVGRLNWPGDVVAT